MFEYYQSLALCWIFFLYSTGEIYLDIITRTYIVEYVSDDQCNLNKTCGLSNDNVRKSSGLSSLYLIYYKILIYSPSVVLGLIGGAYSDRHGRKLPMFLPCLGTILACLFYIPTGIIDDYKITLIIIGTTIQGLFGRNCVMKMSVFSFMSDITEPSIRTTKFGQLLASMYIGLFLGSVISGIFLEFLRSAYAYLAGEIMLVCVVFSILLALTERKSVKTEQGDDKSSIISNVKTSFEVLTRRRPNNLRRLIIVLITVSLVQNACEISKRDIAVMFVESSPLNWPSYWFGYLNAVECGTIGLSLFFVLPALYKNMHLSDRAIIIIGLILVIIHFILLGSSYKSWMVFVSMTIGALGEILESAVWSLLSKSIDEHEIGRTLSILSASEQIAKVIGSILFVGFYGATSHILKGLAYFVQAGVCTIMLGIFIIVSHNQRQDYTVF